AGAVPVVLGGDHSITYSVLRAYGELLQAAARSGSAARFAGRRGWPHGELPQPAASPGPSPAEGGPSVGATVPAGRTGPSPLPSPGATSPRGTVAHPMEGMEPQGGARGGAQGGGQGD